MTSGAREEASAVIRARSTPGKALLAAAAILIIATVTIAVLAVTRKSPARQAGHDLSVYGPQASGVIGFSTVHQGTTYRFAFPVPQNKSDRPVKLTGASLQSLPAGVLVLGYPIYSLAEVGSYLLNYDDSDTANTVRLQTKRDYANTGVTIAAHSDSAYFVMVAVKVTGPVTHTLSGCRFDYSRANHHFTQTFPCEFQLGDSG
jgi:hypothetical protein